MINLLTYTDPSKGFANDEDIAMAKIQIDNALDLGWKRKNILIATDFPFEYNGVRSVIIEDKDPITWNLTQGKIVAITALFAKGVFKENELYWFHDFDAFQLVPFTESQLNLDGFELGLTNCGPRMFNGGSFFFNNKTRDIFDWIMDHIYKEHTDEELSFAHLATTNELKMKERYKLLDRTYNIGIKDFIKNSTEAEMPIKVAHFHPYRRRHLDLFRNILPDRFIKILNNHGIH